MKKKDIRKQVLKSFLENLSGIANKEYQKRVWIRGEGPECDDFTEAVCDFFDLGEPIFDHPKGYGLTENQKKLLMDFQKRFREFSNNHDFPEEFIDTPEWDEIVEKAKKILEGFDYYHYEN